MITIDGGTGKVLHNGVDIASRIMIDQWRRSAALSLNNGENFITTDWERVDGSGQGTCIPGGGMTESGGIFTFPMTGIYKVEWQGYFEETGFDDVNSFSIYVTTNNSDYSVIATSVTSIPDVGSPYCYGNGHDDSFMTFVATPTTVQSVLNNMTYSNDMKDGISWREARKFAAISARRPHPAKEYTERMVVMHPDDYKGSGSKNARFIGEHDKLQMLKSYGLNDNSVREVREYLAGYTGKTSNFHILQMPLFESLYQILHTILTIYQNICTKIGCTSQFYFLNLYTP